jgi:ABC-2 type transport system permease protein
MNSTFAELPAAAAGNPAPPPAAPLGRTLLALVQREFWEHRGLWMWPLCVAGLLVVGAFLAHGTFDAPPFANAESKAALSTILQWGLWVPLNLVMLICVTFYLLDCLYAERRDRTILFWKSLPVSDGLTVLTKLLVAVVIVPFGVFALAIVTHLVFSVVVAMRVALHSAPAILGWDALEWLRTVLALLLVLVIGILWYAPVAASLLLISGWARRNPFVWATLPTLVAPLLERILFGTRYLWSFLSYRTAGIWHTLLLGHSHLITHQRVRPVGTLLNDLNFRGAFLDVDLWLGVVATAALVFAAIRIRRYRDET